MSDPSAEGGARTAVELDRAIEAVLLTSDRPVSAARLAEAFLGTPTGSDAAPAGGEAPAPAEASDGASNGDGASSGDPPAKPARGRGKRTVAASAAQAEELSPRRQIEGSIERLNAAYASTGRAFRIEHVAGGYRLMTTPEASGDLERFHGVRARQSLSNAAVETLAIVAYRQPITRAALETIRGVACGEVLRTLIDRRLVTIVGRAEELGRPSLYGTTREFLDAFGLASVKDLPSPEELTGLSAAMPEVKPIGAAGGSPAPEVEAERAGEAEAVASGASEDVPAARE